MKYFWLLVVSAYMAASAHASVLKVEKLPTPEVGDSNDSNGSECH